MVPDATIAFFTVVFELGLWVVDAVVDAIYKSHRVQLTDCTYKLAVEVLQSCLAEVTMGYIFVAGYDKDRIAQFPYSADALGYIGWKL